MDSDSGDSRVRGTKMKTVVDLVTNLKTYFIGKDTTAKQAVERTIATVETDATSASKGYSVGEQLYLNDILYNVTASITAGDPFTVGTNITVAPKLAASVSGKQDQIEVTTMPTASAAYLGKVLIYIGTTGTYTSGQSYQCIYESGSYSWQPVGGGSVSAANVTYDNTQSGMTADDVQEAVDELNQALANKVSTSDIVNNLTQTTVGKVLDATQGKALDDSITNKHKITQKTVNTSSWTTNTTSQSGTTLYKKSISLSHVYVDSPTVKIGAASGNVLPTVAQQKAYNLLQYVTLDGTTLYLYASAIPENAFYINVEGVD